MDAVNLNTFFSSVRSTVFNGSLTKGQVDGMERIIAYRNDRYPQITADQLAYILATIYWETAHKMQPVREMGGEAYLRTKKYYPWVGEGLVQVTWEVNHRKFGGKKPGDLMTWPIALFAAFEGMWKGVFTGKRLTDYVGFGRRDYMQARRIINGMDRAGEIASIAEKFLRALNAASETPEIREPPIPDVKPVVTYEQFREWLLKAINEDADVRGSLIAAVFPEDGEMGDDPNDAPHDEYGADPVDDQPVALYGANEQYERGLDEQYVYNGPTG